MKFKKMKFANYKNNDENIDNRLINLTNCKYKYINAFFFRRISRDTYMIIIIFLNINKINIFQRVF